MRRISTEVLALLVLCAVVLALVLLLSWAARGVWGAPVPPPPRDIPPETLHGRWRLRWGGHADGRVWFHRDGAYVGYLTPGHTIDHGLWRTEGRQLVLTEWTADPATGRGWGPREYRVEFPGALAAGRCAGTAVGLTERQALDPEGAP